MEYEGTRHNVGFAVLDVLVEEWRQQKRVKSLVGSCEVGSVRVHAAKPQTYMNASGEAVQKLLAWVCLPPACCVVVHDDADIAFGDVRTKFGGGTAGHNGIKSIVQTLGTEDFWRVRVGIGRPENPHAPLDHYVLHRWSSEQKQLLDDTLKHAAHATEEAVIRAAQSTPDI